MPWGGARKNAGRKPKALIDKIAAGNPGHRPLKKMDWGGKEKIGPPEYLLTMDKHLAGIPAPVDIFAKTVKQLEPSDCLELIGEELLAEYAMAKYYLMIAQYELSQTAITGHAVNGEIVVSGFTEAMLKLQKNVVLVWGQIWDIVSRNSETAIKNPEGMFSEMLTGRVHDKPKKGAGIVGTVKNPKHTDDGTESGGV